MSVTRLKCDADGSDCVDGTVSPLTRLGRRGWKHDSVRAFLMLNREFSCYTAA